MDILFSKMLNVVVKDNSGKEIEGGSVYSQDPYINLDGKRYEVTVKLQEVPKDKKGHSQHNDVIARMRKNG